MLTFEATSLGVPFMIARLCMSIVGIILIAAIMCGALSPDDKNKIYHSNQ